MSAKTFLDTNILIYAHDNAYPDKMAKAQEIIFMGVRSGLVSISAQVLSEFFVTITQKVKKPMSVDRALRELELLASLETAEIDASMVLRAVGVKQRWQLSYWDSLIIAAAERTRCAIVYSEDFTDGRRFGAVTVKNPFL
jgi:predicted nucleic acid-binding protein